MRRLTCFSIAILLLSLAPATRAQFRVGVVGGLNFARVDAEVARLPTEVTSRTLWGLGSVIDWQFNQTFALRFEPMYLQKGVGKTELAIQPGVAYKSKSSFLELPLFFKAEFGKTIKPYVMAGPSVGILLSSDVEAEVTGITFKGDATDASKKVDFSLAFGAGLSYPIGRSTFFLEGRYSLGLTDNVKGGTFGIAAGPVMQEIEWDAETDKIKNRGFQVMAGVTFPLGGS